MESRKVPGCFLLAEIVDVTGHLAASTSSGLVIRRGAGRSI